MKKILMIGFLFLNSTFSFAQYELKIDLFSLRNKRLDLTLEKRIKKFGFEFSGEFSTVSPIEKNKFEVNCKPRVGFGLNIRYYYLNKKMVSLYLGGVSKHNFQKFSIDQNLFLRKERFTGGFLGTKVKVSKHLFLDSYLGLSYKPLKKFIDVNRNFEVIEKDYYSGSTFLGTPSSWAYGEFNFVFLTNFSINYQF